MKQSNENSSDSLFIKPLTSFLKDTSNSLSTSNKIFYSDKENDLNNPIFTRKAPSSVTRITPLYDENLLRNQQKALIGLSDQVRQLKLNNEDLAKDNYGINKVLEEKDNKLKNYEDVMLKLYKERPPKDPSNLKHKFQAQDQKDLDNLMNEIIRRKVEKEPDIINNSNINNLAIIKTKDANIQVDIPIAPLEKNDLKINLELNSPMASPRHLQKNQKAGYSPRSPSRSPKKATSVRDKKDINLKKIDETVISSEKLNKLRLNIINVFNEIKDVNINMTSENFAFTLNLPYFLEEDSEDQIVQFQDFGLYNLSSKLGLGSRIYHWIKVTRDFFSNFFECKWILRKFQTISYSHKYLLAKYEEMLNFHVRSAFYEKFMAFLSLFDDIPASDNKESISKKLANEEDENFEHMSDKKTRKLKSKVMNLETKFLVFLIREKLKDHCEIFKLYFNEKRALYLFSGLDSIDRKTSNISRKTWIFHFF